MLIDLTWWLYQRIGNRLSARAWWWAYRRAHGDPAIECLARYQAMIM